MSTPECSSRMGFLAIAEGIAVSMNLVESLLLLERLYKQHQNKDMLGAICLLSTLVLRPAGVLDGMKGVTCNLLTILTPQRVSPLIFIHESLVIGLI